MAIAAVVAALAREVRADGWDGIMLDIEALGPRDRAGLTRFVAGLRATLPRAVTVGVTLSNHTRAAPAAATPV